MKPGEVRIGTSGWHYKHWIGNVYPPRWPASRMLNWYQERFDTVELNNSFYHLPPESALRNWYRDTPEGFVFAVKGSRFITHMKKLKDPEPALARFFSRAELLREKMGPVLFQLPPNFEKNIDRFAEFLEALPKHHRYAFEFRNPSWDAPEILGLLRQHRAAYCPFHLAGYQSPIEITTDMTYIRLHGPGGKYQGSYDDKTLSNWARRIRCWQRELNAIYVYFDNDDSGFAAHNALRLRHLVTEATTA